MRELRRRSISATLHIVGTTPPNPVDPGLVKIHGVLDKTVSADLTKLEGLFRTSDVFILPSSSEGFVIVVLEAAAYGLPSLAYDVDGVTTAVVDNVSGRLLKPGQPEMDFADVVEQWFDNPSDYDRLVAGARKHYEETANWKKSVATLFTELGRHLQTGE